MNPFGLDVTALLIWGLVAHLVADWGLQSAWMAKNKDRRWVSGRRRRAWQEAHRGTVYYVGEWGEYPGPRARWWSRHPAAYAHAGVHVAVLAPVFGWPAGIIGLCHLLIDTRTPVVWWSKLMRQEQPSWRRFVEAWAASPESRPYSMNFDSVAWKTRTDGPDAVTEALEQARAVIPHTPLTISGPGTEVVTVAEAEAMVRAARKEASGAVEKLMADMCEWSSNVGYSMGHEVRVWLDQTFHVATLAAAALIVVAL